MKKEDLRTIKTKQLIKHTFLKLMKEKGYQHITVTDVAEQALINRKTFYAHYDSIEALYLEITAEYIRLLDFSSLFSTKQIDLVHSDFKTVAISMMKKIREEKEVFLILMNDSTNVVFNEKLKIFFGYSLSRSQALTEYAAEKKLPFELLLNIYSSIFLEIAKWWLIQEDTSAEQAMQTMLSMFSDKIVDALGIRIIP